MENTQENRKKAIQYLYGDLDESAFESFEEQLFIDENLSLFVNDVENDLIDEYVRGELEFEQKREFEAKYLTTSSRHERIALARTLQSELFAEKKETVISTDEKTSIWQNLTGLLKAPNLALAGGLATILLLVLLGGIWFASQPNGNENIASGGNNNNRENVSPIQETPSPEVSPTPKETPLDNSKTEGNENKSDANKQVNVEKEKQKLDKVKDKPTPTPVEKKPKDKNQKPKTVQPKQTVFAFSLFPPLRSSQNPVLNIPASAKTVNLQLVDNFGQKYEKFIVELNNSTGSTIWSREVNASKKRPQKSIGISLSESKFESGNYEIAVRGVTKEGSVEEISFYNFVIQRK